MLNAMWLSSVLPNWVWSWSEQGGGLAPLARDHIQAITRLYGNRRAVINTTGAALVEV